MKFVVLLFTVFLLNACGTMKTVDFPQKERVSISLNGKKTSCREITRIYSGVAYNVCSLYARAPLGPVSPYGYNPMLSVYGILFDTTTSAISDTLLLPYTLHGQVTKGNIKVR